VDRSYISQCLNAHEIKPGVIYRDANVTVTAFATKHAMESYGYRFDTPDRRIGDAMIRKAVVSFHADVFERSRALLPNTKRSM
jgi:ribonuclease BN (tRNA processing enzyme)